MPRDGGGHGEWRRRPLTLLAMAGVLMLSVEYRAGADTAHPHAVFQLWYDAAHGSVDHHVDGYAPEPAVSHQGAEALGANAPGKGSGASVARRRDVPAVTEAGLAVGGMTFVIVVVQVGLALVLLRSRLPWCIELALEGATVRPSDPPPRSDAICR